jgi:hypothetical protein
MFIGCYGHAATFRLIVIAYGFEPFAGLTGARAGRLETDPARIWKIPGKADENLEPVIKIQFFRGFAR